MIKNLVEKLNEVTDIFGVVKNMTEKNNNLFVTLEDLSGTVALVLWDYSKEQFSFTVGKIIKVRGTISQYNNSIQVKPEKKDGKYLIREVKEEDNINLSDFIKESSPSKEIVLSKLVEDISNKTLKKYCTKVCSILEEHRDYPYNFYSKNYKGGLLEGLNELYEKTKVFKGYNQDLLIATILFYGLGKIYSFEVDPITYKILGHTKQGYLLGETAISLEKTTEIFNSSKTKEDMSEYIDLIKHILLSSRYEESWGALRKPMIKEAELFHLLTQNEMQESLINENLPEQGQFNKMCKSALGKTIYNPKL